MLAQVDVRFVLALMSCGVWFEVSREHGGLCSALSILVHCSRAFENVAAGQCLRGFNA